MHLPLFIARRYLFAKKSHNVINIISAISAIGMAIGTAALIIILSVYNGFDSLVRSSLSNVEPDILVTPTEGKVFVPKGDGFDWLYEQKSVKTICSILEENVYITYDGRNGVAKARGVDKVYEEESPIKDHIVDGKFALHHGEIQMCVVGAGLAASLDLSPRFLAPVDIWFPARDRQLSMANPMAALENITIYPEGVFCVNADIDNELILLSIEEMRDLLDYKDEVSGIEVRLDSLAGKKELGRIIKELQTRLGDGFQVSDRFHQNETLYKMMRYEKASVWLILVFVIIIIAFNIFGSLSMLIIEKKNDIETLRSLGAKDSLVRHIFILEGWMISLLGMVAGLAVGLLFIAAQMKFGFIMMPGSFMASPYPVILKWGDVAVTAISVAAVGYAIALLPVLSFSRAEKR